MIIKLIVYKSVRIWRNSRCFQYSLLWNSITVLNLDTGQKQKYSIWPDISGGCDCNVKIAMNTQFSYSIGFKSWKIMNWNMGHLLVEFCTLFVIFLTYLSPNNVAAIDISDTYTSVSVNRQHQDTITVHVHGVQPNCRKDIRGALLQHNTCICDNSKRRSFTFMSRVSSILVW